MHDIWIILQSVWEFLNPGNGMELFLADPITLGIAGTGAAASLFGGMKGGGEANLAREEQARQRELQEKFLGIGLGAFNPAAEYWQSLLKGGQAARVATAPFAQDIRATHQAGRRTIGENLPRGGERNLAMAQSQVGQASDLARLYAGVQPAAAGALGQLAGLPFGVAGGAGAQSGALTGGLLGYGIEQQRQAQAGAGGIGRLLFQLSNKEGGLFGGGGGSVGLDTLTGTAPTTATGPVLG